VIQASCSGVSLGCVMEEFSDVHVPVAGEDEQVVGCEFGLLSEAAVNRGAGDSEYLPELLGGGVVVCRKLPDSCRYFADFVGHMKTIRLKVETFNPFHDFGSFVRIKGALHKRNVGYATPLAVCQDAD